MNKEDYKIAYKNVMIANKMLEQENKQLEDLLHKANDEVISYTNCCIDLKEKIDKAINYIKNKLDEQKEEQKDLPFQLVDVDYTNLLEILGDKE